MSALGAVPPLAGFWPIAARAQGAPGLGLWNRESYDHAAECGINALAGGGVTHHQLQGIERVADGLGHSRGAIAARDV